MKKTIYILTLIAGILSSCTFEEENIFDKSAAERMNLALKDYKSILTAEKNGWIMEYFPTDTTEGYTFIMKFDASTKVTMAAKNRWVNNAYTVDSCVFDLIGDNGPVLTFPMAGSYKTGGTQIGIFHLFSSPQNPKGGSGLDGYGLQGDYEFVLKSVTDTLILLNGKKRNTEIRMYPVPTGMSWIDVFSNLDKMRTTLVGNGNFPLYMALDKDTFVLKNDLKSYGAKAGKFRIYPKGADQLIDGTDYAYIFTLKGLRFHTAIEHNQKKVSDFTLSSDKLKLLSTTTDLTATIYGTNPIEYVLSNNVSCDFVFTQPMGTKMKTVYDKIVANCQSKFKEKFTDLYFKYNAARKSYTLAFKSGKYTGYFDFTRVSSSINTVRFNYSGTKDVNGDSYYKNIPGFQELIAYMSQNFKIESYDGLGSPLIKFTATADSDISFIVSI